MRGIFCIKINSVYNYDGYVTLYIKRYVMNICIKHVKFIYT
jgi:hypothetical protein